MPRDYADTPAATFPDTLPRDRGESGWHLHTAYQPTETLLGRLLTSEICSTNSCHISGAPPSPRNGVIKLKGNRMEGYSYKAPPLPLPEMGSPSEMVSEMGVTHTKRRPSLSRRWGHQAKG